MGFSDSSWSNCPDTGRSTVAYIIFDQGVSIYHGTHFPGSVAKLSAESEYNSAGTAGKSLEHFRVLINEFLNKDPYIVPEEDLLFVLDGKSAICMSKNGKDNRHTSPIARRINFVRNREKCNIYKIYWCEGGLQLAYIATNNVGKHDLTPRMKFIMVRIGQLI